MAMRMSPQVGQQSFLPAINRSSLVFFAGLILIVLNFYWQNGSAALTAIFHPGASVEWEGMSDTGLQIIGLALLTLAAEYFGDNAGTAALLFVGACWLLWLVLHVGSTPQQAVTHTDTTGSSPSFTPTPTNNNPPTPGGSGGQKK